MSSPEPQVARRPTITAVIAAYNSERWIGEAVDSILAQTRPPEQIVVVDDGSTDGTAEVLRGYAERGVEVVTRVNGGCPAAFNTAFSHARGDYVAMCGADDIWLPEKLEMQAAALEAHPEIDLAFGHAEVFGAVEGEYERAPRNGIQDQQEFRRALYDANFVCAPTIVIRRSMFEALGPFQEDFGADDYEYWFRCLRADATVHYEPRVLIRYRRHDANLSSRLRWMLECLHEVHVRYADLLADQEHVHDVLSTDLLALGSFAYDDGELDVARRAFRAAIGHRRTMRGAVWLAVLGLPDGLRKGATAQATRISRALATRRTAEAGGR